MIRKTLIPMIILGLHSANVQAAPLLEPTPQQVTLLQPKLNSDRIEYFFGNYGVEKMNVCSRQFPHGRISDLYSTHDQQKIMRTLAMVDFANPIPTELQSVHEKIEKGASIGIALRQAGWTIEKKPVYFGELPISTALAKRMQTTSPAMAATHVYQLVVSKDSQPSFPYCTIIEIHSPQYLTPKWLAALNATDFSNYQTQSSDVKKLLRRVDACLQEIK